MAALVAPLQPTHSYTIFNNCTTFGVLTCSDELPCLLCSRQEEGHVHPHSTPCGFCHLPVVRDAGGGHGASSAGGAGGTAHAAPQAQEDDPDMVSGVETGEDAVAYYAQYGQDAAVKFFYCLR